MEPLQYRVIICEDADYSATGKFNPMMDDLKDYLPFFDKKLIFHAAAIEYWTKAPDGSDVLASGIVYHPINKKSKGVIDMMPKARMHKNSGSAEGLFSEEGMCVLLGYTVIVPDLLGVSSSRHMTIPFLMVENTGRVAYDMRRAAAQYLWDKFGYKLPFETTIMGYSLGGSAALAAQKYYETHHANNVKVKEVNAGGGTYDLVAAFNAFARTGYSDYAAIPLVILAFNEYYHLNLDINQIFFGDLAIHYEDWFGGSHSSRSIMGWLTTDLHTYMHPDFFKPKEEQNDEFKKLYPLLVENSVSEGWRPKAPIYLTHANVDTYVPRECADEAVKKLRKAGANIWCAYYLGDHYSVGATYFIRNFLRLL